MRRYTLLILLILGSAGPVRASTWAEGMFDEFICDFGCVPKGQVLTHPFRIVNNTKGPVRISTLRVSCSRCTSLIFEGKRRVNNEQVNFVLAPGQETAVVVEINTRLFTGPKTDSLVYVQFDSPRFQEVKLTLLANSRTEMSYAPDSLDFKKIRQGTTPTMQMTVTITDNPQIVLSEAKCESNFIQPKLMEIYRDGGGVTYQVSATVRNDIPVGKWFTDVWLATNSAAMPKMRVPLTIEVEAPPQPQQAPPPTRANAIVLEPVKAGMETDRKVILRGTQPFRITGIQGADQEVIIGPVSNDSRALHELTLTFRPGQGVQPGQVISRTIRVQTDMTNNKNIEFNAQTQVAP